MKKSLKKSTALQQAGYKGVKVTSMIKAIEQQEIFKYLRLVQQDEFCRLRNRYNKNGYLTKPYMTYLFNLYWNFVLNDFRFDDKSKVWTVPTKMKSIEPQHIGLKIFNKLKDTKTFYRVCHKETKQGLWYDFLGEFKGLIHERFNFCKNCELKMEFDDELVGWLSATDSLEDLFNWFPKEDIIKLQEHGWFIYEFKTTEFKFYDKFKHFVIKQDSSKRSKRIVL